MSKRKRKQDEDNLDVEASNKQISDQKADEVADGDSNSEDTSHSDSSASCESYSTAMHHKAVKIFKTDKPNNGKL